MRDLLSILTRLTREQLAEVYEYSERLLQEQKAATSDAPENVHTPPIDADVPD